MVLRPSSHRAVAQGSNPTDVNRAHGRAITELTYLWAAVERYRTLSSSGKTFLLPRGTADDLADDLATLLATLDRARLQQWLQMDVSDDDLLAVQGWLMLGGPHRVESALAGPKASAADRGGFEAWADGEELMLALQAVLEQHGRFEVVRPHFDPCFKPEKLGVRVPEDAASEGAFSREAAHSGKSSEDDRRWWLRTRSAARGHDIWGHRNRDREEMAHYSLWVIDKVAALISWDLWRASLVLLGGVCHRKELLGVCGAVMMNGRVVRDAVLNSSDEIGRLGLSRESIAAGLSLS